MSDSEHSVPIPRHSPHLPPELISQILQDSSLSKSDLARCCLVSRQFTRAARSTLYLFMTFVPTWIVLSPEWKVDLTTQLILRSLSENPTLRQHARKAIFRVNFPDQEEKEVYMGPEYEDPGKVVEHALEMLPRLNSLDFDEHTWLSDYTVDLVFARGSQWTEISIDAIGIMLDERTAGNRKTWSKLPNLRKLKCSALSKKHNASPVPNHLEVLDVCDFFTGDCPLLFPPGSGLRVLRTVLSENNLHNLEHLRQLRHLYLIVVDCSTALSLETLSSLSRLPLLESLSIQSDQPPQHYAKVVYPLFHHLPRSIQRLDFPRFVPFDALSDFLRTDAKSRIQILGLDESLLSMWDHLRPDELHECEERLREICDEKGITIEHITTREDIFHV